MFRTKKFLSLVTSICLLLETALPPTVFAAGALTPNVSYVSPSNSPSPPRTNPGSDLVFKFVAVNTTGIAGSSPYVAFSGSQSGYSFVNSGTGFMISWGVTTLYSVSGFNPPASATGTLSLTLPTSAASFGFSGTTFNVPQSYPYKTFDFTLTFGATGISPVTKTGSVAINVVPHVRSASFTKPSIVSNGVDSARVTADIMDRNGCSDISSAHADLSQLWGSSIEPLSFVSCAADGITATYQSSPVTTFVGAGPKTVAITAMDSAGYFQASDSIFSSDDLVSSTTVTVNSPTAPVVTISSVSPNLLRAGQTASVTWQSTQTGSYRVYAGANAACGSGTASEVGTVSSVNSDVVSTVTSDTLSEGSNLVTVCVLNSEPTEGSVSAAISRDSVSPTVSPVSSSNNIVSQDVSATFSANEAGTYRVFVNDVNIGVTGSYSGSNSVEHVTVSNSAFGIDPGNNTMYVTVTDDAGNIGTSPTSTIYKDGTPPPPVTWVALSDCDSLSNAGTPCAALWNARSGISGRDFSVSWTPPSASASGSFESYKLYVLPQGTPFTGSGQTALKNVFTFSQTGTVLDDAVSADSAGGAFSQSGSSTYVAYVVVRKSNGLESTAASSSGAAITADAITYPHFVSAAFVSNTGIALTYDKALSSTLSNMDSSKLFSPSGCFTVNSASGTSALSVSGSVAVFSVDGLWSGSKTCSDLAVQTWAVRDSQGLYSEEVLSGKNVSDSQLPTISITSPSAGSFIAWAGVFTLVYALSENMSGSTLAANFTDSSWAVVSASLSSAATAWAKSKTFTGSAIGLVDGKTYSLRISGADLAGNAGTSSAVSGIVYDVSAPSTPVLSAPADNSYVKLSSPALTWAGSTDNSSSSASIGYEIQIATKIDFSAMHAFGTTTGTASFSVSPALVTNTGYYWRVRPTDSAGNVGSWSAVRAFFFDDVAPSVSASSYVWNNARSFSGYVKSGDSLQLRAPVTDNYASALFATGITADLSPYGGAASVNASVFSAGRADWNFTASCTDGTKSVLVTATDLAGNSSNRSVSAICDNTAPAVTDSTVTSPTAGAFVSGGTSTNVLWNTAFYSTEASPVANPVTIEYSSDGGTSWNTVAASVTNGGTVPWTVPTSDTSTFKIRLSATDLLGNTASGITTFTVDSTNPSVASDSLTYPNGGEYLKGSTGTGITVTWNPAKITDANIAASPITLEYSSNGGTSWNAIASGLPNSGSYVWNTGVLDSGSVKIRITATDKVGRTSSDTSDAVFTVDSTLPAVVASSPPTPPDNAFVSGSGFDVGVSGSDANLAKVSYSFTDGSFYWNASSTSWLGGQQWNDLCTSSATCANYAGTLLPAVSDGSSYQLVFRATDRAGNVKDTSVYHYVGDAVSPVITSNVSTGSYFSGSLSLIGTSTDARSGVSSVKASFLRNSDGKYFVSPASGFSASSETLLATATSNSYANWTYTGFSVPVWDADGTTYSLTILWTDNAYKFNNETRTQATFTKDATGPSVASDVWINPASAGLFWKWSNAKTLTWNPAKITDALSGVNSVSGVTVEYSTGGSWNPIGSGIANSGSVNWTVPLIDADVTFRISAKDALGNVSAWVVSPAVTVDSLPPQISTVETLDRAAGGKVDGLLVTMTEPVKCSTLRAQDFSVASVGAPAATSGCAGNSSTFVLEFSPYGDTSSIPSLTYFTGGTLTDRADNLLVGVVKSSVDKAVPRLLSASVYDSNSNGKIDQIRATFSESLQSSSDVSSWTFVGAPSGMGSAPVSTSVSGNSATLTSSEPAAFETSTGGLSIAFAAASFWKDASGNLAAPKASLILGDSAAPRVTSAVTVENASGNYALDVTFSESLSGTSLSGFSLSGSATYSGTVTQTATKTFRFATADSAASNTAKPYSYSYVPGTVTDPSGNSLAAIGSTSFSDGIAPKIISRQTRDSNGNGKIDAVAIGFSETLNSNVSGLSAAVSGYSVSGYSSSGTGLTVSLTERGVPDTDTAPNVQITNVSLADVAGNLFGSEASVTAAADSVWPVVQAARYDGASKVVVTLSEPYSGTPNASWFSFSGTAVSVSSAVSLSSNEIELTVSGAVTYGTTSVSATSNTVPDALGNKQSTVSYVTLSASVVINEVMWSNSGSSLTQYVELRNLGPSSIDVSGFKIDAASTNGTATLTLPASQTIAGNGYYLIAASAPSTAGNLLAASVSPNSVGSLSLSSSQTANLVLKNGSGSVYDRAKANPFPAGSGSAVVSMERKDTPGDGLAATNWYDAQTGATFFDSAVPKGTPGSANVFDATAPIISSVTPADSALLASGTGITVTYAYSDDVLIDALPVRTFKLEKNDGSGNFSDVTSASVSSSGADASQAHFDMNPLVGWAYRATFTVRDSAGNVGQKISTFYVDIFSMSVSTGFLSVGTLTSGNLGTSSVITVTVRTVWAPFVLSLGSGSLSAGYDVVPAWTGTDGYGFACSVSDSAGWSTCDSTTRALSGSVLQGVAGPVPDSNGNLKTYTYLVTFSAKVDALRSAGSYAASHQIGVSVSY